ncbi:MAG: alpha-amylase family glycosyl hydrolase [Bacteroidota bacterium]|nr:alpha-amylase family glycosyl hydrolase [Bacteroidota bacterium]MDP4194308.1 alpha-amylase family glycosyl hydrolase [Bacteroidota bacterium]
MGLGVNSPKKYGFQKKNRFQVLKVSIIFLIAFIILTSDFVSAQTQQPQQQAVKESVKHPEWSRNQTIYEVNIRQYSKGGTFKDFEAQLPRLKEMGVGILWLMPINPIGEKNRKGTLGSYYAVKDYLAVNQEFGNMDDFKSLVKKTHQLGMKIIIDWVANHTSWDNELTKTHPEFYAKDSAGNFVAPVKDWSDVIKLDYNNKDLWKYMKDALAFWIKQADIDGFRCDVASMVPTPFWDYARAELDKIKPVFMLAEAEVPELHAKAFDMTYSWRLYHIFNSIASGDSSADAINNYFNEDEKLYPKDAYRMCFTTNHDENSWNGTEFERLKNGVEAFSVLAFTVKGFPLLYSGQETGLNKRLNFFERDPIEWKDSKYKEFYTKLVKLRLNNKALLSGDKGGEMISIPSSNEKAVYSFTREKGKDKILVITNLSDKDQTVTLSADKIKGSYKDLFTGKKYSLKNKEEMTLKPWQYLLLVK